MSNEWYLMTLTAHSRTRTAQSSLENLRVNIDRIMKRIRRVFGAVEYVRVYERHPSSQAIHVHFIVSGLSPYVVPGCWKNLQPGFLAITQRKGHRGTWSLKTWLKHTAQDCGIGYIADVRLIDKDTSFAINYVTKYLTKAQQDIRVKGLRHVQTSRGIGSPQTDSDKEWQTGSIVTLDRIAPGSVLIDQQTGEMVDSDYWLSHNYYPPDADTGGHFE